MEDIRNILKKHRLRITEGRIGILQYFLDEKKALSHRDLEFRFNELDRVTLYRTLQSFTEKGVLHKIPSDTGNVTYGVCFDTCSPQVHQHEHIHFECMSCGKTECIDLDVPELEVPGYRVTEKNFLLKGICSDCSEN